MRARRSEGREGEEEEREGDDVDEREVTSTRVMSK